MKDFIRNVAIVALAFSALGVAYSLQMSSNLQPCTMCIVQRYAFMVIGVGAVGRYVLSEAWRPMWPYTSTRAAIVGLLASIRIQWAISVPSLSCGRDKVAAALNGAPWVDAWPAMFEATGVCGDKVAPVMGLPFHGWSALLFLIIAMLVWFPRRPRAGT